MRVEIAGGQREEFTLFEMRKIGGCSCRVSGDEAYKEHDGTRTFSKADSVSLAAYEDPLEQVVVILWSAGQSR